jgi:Spy/CpxP family protein refolding chaperone
MKFYKMKYLGVTLALAICLCWVVLAEAGMRGRCKWHPGLGSCFAGLKGFLELKLTESQQAEMMNIINKYHNERETLRKAMMDARENISITLKTDQFNEEAFRKAFRKTSAIKEEMCVLRAKMMAEMKAILTPEQFELLKAHRAQRLERGRHRLDTMAEPGNK